MKVVLETVTVHADERGFVLEPLTLDQIGRQRNVHLVQTLPGQIRGNHYHRKATEILTVVGPALLRYRDGAAVEDVWIEDGKAVRFTFPPGVAHAIRNTGDRPNLLIAFTDREHDRQSPDVVRDMLMEA